MSKPTYQVMKLIRVPRVENSAYLRKRVGSEAILPVSDADVSLSDYKRSVALAWWRTGSP